MGRPLRIGLLSPYFGTVLGGGERYLGETAMALRDAYPEATIEISCPVPVDLDAYGSRLGLDLSGLRVHATNRRVTPLHRALNSLKPLRPLRNRVLGAQAGRVTARYDVLLAMVYAIPIASSCERSLMLCQFPYREAGPELQGYRGIICQSEYVAGWIRRYWARDPVVVTPPIEQPPAAPDVTAKEQIVLSVGRFFAGGHAKRQDVLVEAFRRLCDEGLDGWELHLAGGLHDAPQHRDYFARIRAMASGYPIRLHPDCPRAELEALYQRAAIYWHAAGYGADPETEPEALEHFGMSTAEATARGAVPVVFAGGGQLEVVDDGRTGYTWNTLEQLQNHTRRLAAQPDERRRVAAAAVAASTRFTRARFRAEVLAQVEPLVREASASLE